MKVLSMTKSGEYYKLSLEGETKRTLTVPLGYVIEYNIRKGAQLLPDILAQLTYEDELYRSAVKTLRLLAVGDKSTFMIRSRLAADGFSEEAIDEAVRMAVERGYIDEERQIRDEALRLAKTDFRSRRFITAKLVSRGYPAELVEGVIDELVASGEIDFSDIFERLVEKLGITDEDERAALYYKRGFADDEY